MKEDKDILSRINRRDGMTVPDGWFDDFASRMADSLPERPALENASPAPVSRTIWERIRPYVYMAAMFAGVWCMPTPCSLKLSTTKHLLMTIFLTTLTNGMSSTI
jgi:hypothetical protein